MTTATAAADADQAGIIRPRRRWVRAVSKRLAIVGLIVFVFWATGCMERLFYYPERGPTPIPPSLRGGESVTFSSGDGTRLHGWFIPARTGQSSREAATIIHAHGNAANIANHIAFSEQFVRAGFNLFIFDYRGYGESEGSARKRSDLIADTRAALDAVLARPDVDPTRIGLYGQSLGGAIGLNVMADRHEIRAAVIESAFASWRDIAADVLGGGESGFFSRFVASILISDQSRVDEALAKIDRPILLLHGTADGTIPAHHSRRLAAAGGANVKLIEIPGGDHNSLHETHPEVEQIMNDFFRLHLAGNSPAPSMPPTP